MPKQVEVTDPNCPVWGVVDFGDGPTAIRCTNPGKHTDHFCFVVMLPEDEEPSAEMTSLVQDSEQQVTKLPQPESNGEEG